MRVGNAFFQACPATKVTVLQTAESANTQLTHNTARRGRACLLLKAGPSERATSMISCATDRGPTPFLTSQSSAAASAACRACTETVATCTGYLAHQTQQTSTASWSKISSTFTRSTCQAHEPILNTSVGQTIWKKACASGAQQGLTDQWTQGPRRHDRLTGPRRLCIQQHHWQPPSHGLSQYQA